MKKVSKEIKLRILEIGINTIISNEVRLNIIYSKAYIMIYYRKLLNRFNSMSKNIFFNKIDENRGL